MQMEYRFSCDYVFQVCSRLHHHKHPNTNFTDFEAGVAVFFSHDLTKRLSQSVKSRSMLNGDCKKQHKSGQGLGRRRLIAFAGFVREVFVEFAGFVPIVVGTRRGFFL